VRRRLFSRRVPLDVRPPSDITPFVTAGGRRGTLPACHTRQRVGAAERTVVFVNVTAPTGY
jgi:hypothetical protein